ncbi:SHOCT domain-containing protein (plasmid) [Streptomyces sp. G6]|uniref:SHOCT domain-containing protein n=1 Tax=Streptomyces sp. G6 TaxID=1178736 RepID=UPI003ED91D32
MMNDMMSGMGAWMILWGLLAFVLLVLVVIGATWLVRSLTGQSRPRRQVAPERPEEILRRRYAAGEIGEEEYLRRLSGLDKS